MITKIEELPQVLKQPAYLEFMRNVISDSDGAFSSFTDLFSTFEDHVFKMMTQQYSKKNNEELMYEIINKVSNSLLRCLSPLLWPSDVSNSENTALMDPTDTYFNAKID